MMDVSSGRNRRAERERPLYDAFFR